MRTYNEVTGELRKDTQKRQNVKQKCPLRSGILNHFLLSFKGGSVFHKPLPLWNLSTDALPSPQSAQVTSMRKVPVPQVDLRMGPGSTVAGRRQQGMVERKREWGSKEPETQFF